MDKKKSALFKKLDLLSLLTLLGLFLISTPPVSAQNPLEPIIESNETGITLTWTPPAFSLTDIRVDGSKYSQLRMPSTSLSGEPGHPELPLYSGLIGLPPSGEARLHVVEVKRETVPLPAAPLPAPSPRPVQLSPAEIDPFSFQSELTDRQPDPAVYAADTFYPAAFAQLGPLQQLRDRRIAALTIYPLRVNPAAGQMEVVRFIRLEITFTQPARSTPALSGQSVTDPLAQALQPILLNPEAAQWTGDLARSFSQQSVSAASTGPTFKIKVAEAGLYALTYSDLQNAGLPVTTLDPRTLTLSYGYPRQEVAILVEGEADGVFHPGDRLLFYAEPTFSRYVDHDIYFLSYGGTNGLRMSSRSGSPAGLPAGTAWRVATAEGNGYYDPLYPGHRGDYWYWDKLFLPSQPSRTYTIQVAKPLASGPNATLTLWLQGYTDPAQNPDHKVKAKVNGASAGDISWNGKQAITATFAIASSVLLNGSNQVNLSLPGSGTSVEGTWLEAMTITYPTNQATTGQLRFQGEAGRKSYTLTGWSSGLRVYDVTNPLAPQQVTGFSLAGSTLTVGDASASSATYLVVPASALKTVTSISQAKVAGDPSGGADYIIITPPPLAGAVAPLAAYRAGQGLRVAAVDVEAIYDTYGQGRMDAEAIKTFLQHAYATWPSPAPLYVLLVGDGSYDFKNHSGFNPQTLMPPYLAQVDPYWGETAADNRLVMFTGNDNLPDMLIGRFSANTPAEVTTIVNKVIQYETSPAPDMWNAFQLFVADNPDSAGNFYSDSDQGYDEVQAPFIGQRYYFGNGTSSQPYIYPTVDLLRSSFLAGFNNGTSLVTFNGHSSWHQWARESLLHLNDISSLNNQNRLPVMLEMTCFTGFFHHPQYPTLDESLLRRTGGGAIAVWGSTGLGVSTGHTVLQSGFLQAIMPQGETKLGAAVLAGKSALHATGFHLDLLDTMTLFGDPALKLHLPVTPINYTDHLYLPMIARK
ncbi:MAG: hypothetical protein HS126_35655 [Anaerolineales bacterium]|nr:hypothetical protein [Anaerolineales bacterium]